MEDEQKRVPAIACLGFLLFSVTFSLSEISLRRIWCDGRKKRGLGEFRDVLRLSGRTDAPACILATVRLRTWALRSRAAPSTCSSFPSLAKDVLHSTSPVAFLLYVRC